jgi:heptosyltransferase-2
VTELWGLGDLALAAPFLRAAGECYQLTLLGKPNALQLKPRFWPNVDVIPLVAPWTAFSRKYYLPGWPWRELLSTVRRLRADRFDIAVSARWDPRDHGLIFLSNAPRRAGFPRLSSGALLTDPLPLPPPDSHRYENWRILARHFGLELPPREKIVVPPRPGKTVVIHTGAAQPARVWPLASFQFLVQKLRQDGRPVQILCDASQRSWWESHGETVAVPRSLEEIMQAYDHASLFVGNDSGPGHLAALCGVPTFSLFGNQFANLFAPLHPRAHWIEGASCPYKPCYDTCRFPQPNCLFAIAPEAAWQKLKPLLD